MHKRKDYYKAGGYNGRGIRKKKEVVLRGTSPKEVHEKYFESNKPKEKNIGFLEKLKTFWGRNKRKRGKV